MILRHGLFALKDGCDQAGFQWAFEAFSQHLQEQALLVGCRFMRQERHDGYNRRPPETPY